MKRIAKVETGKNIELRYGSVRIGKAINSPKLNDIAIACKKLQEIAGNKGTDKVTGFGHLQNCKGGIIDNTIFSGNVHSIESFITSLSNSGLKNVENDRKKYSADTFKAVLAKRTVDHIQWCSNTLNNSHGGFGSRLEKTGLSGKRAEIAGHLKELAGLLKSAYTANYAGLYRNRNKNGLK